MADDNRTNETGEITLAILYDMLTAMSHQIDVLAAKVDAMAAMVVQPQEPPPHGRGYRR